MLVFHEIEGGCGDTFVQLQIQNILYAVTLSLFRTDPQLYENVVHTDLLLAVFRSVVFCLGLSTASLNQLSLWIVYSW